MEIKTDRQYLVKKANKYNSAEEFLEDLTELQTRASFKFQSKLKTALEEKDALTSLFVIRSTEYDLYDDRRMSLYFSRLMINEIERQVLTHKFSLYDAFNLSMFCESLEFDEMSLSDGSFEEQIIHDPTIRLHGKKVNKLIIKSSFIPMLETEGESLLKSLYIRSSIEVINEIQVPKSAESLISKSDCDRYFKNTQIVFKENK